MKKYYDYEFRPLDESAFVEKYLLVLEPIRIIMNERVSMGFSPDLVEVLTDYVLMEDTQVGNWIHTEESFNDEEGAGEYEEWFNYMLERSRYVYCLQIQQYMTFWDGCYIYLVDDSKKSRWVYYCD